METELITAVGEYPCTKCNKLFLTPASQKNHEYFRCTIVCLEDNMNSPLPYSDSMETHLPVNCLDSTILETTPSPSTSGSYQKWLEENVFYEDISQDVQQTVEVISDQPFYPENTQQSVDMIQRASQRSVQEIMKSTKHSYFEPTFNMKNNGKGNKFHTPLPSLDTRVWFEGESPMLATDVINEFYEDEKKIQQDETVNDVGSPNPEFDLNGLDDIDFSNIDVGEIFNDICKLSPDNFSMHNMNYDGHAEDKEKFMPTLKEESLSSLSMEMAVNCMDVDEGYSSPLTQNTGCQLTINELVEKSPDLISFMNCNDNTTTMIPSLPQVSLPPVSLPPKQLKRGRGRPRKVNQSIKPITEPQDTSQDFFLNYAVLPSRKSKLASLEKIRNSISEESNSAASSDHELSSGMKETSSKRIRKLSCRLQEDSDYEASDTSDSFSYQSAGELRSVDSDKRVKNNEASKRSRQKRKEQDRLMAAECERLKERNVILNEKAQKLQDAIDLVLRCITSANKC